MVDWLEQIDGDTLVLVANSRLLKYAQQRFAQRQQELGNTVWESPHIYTWYGYLAEQYKFWRRHQLDAPNLLGTSQERLLWQTSLERILRNGQRSGLMDKSKASKSAQRSYLMMQEWQISLEQLRDQNDQDGQLFAEWIDEFKRECDSRGWLDNAALNGWALTGFEFISGATIIWLGFDLFTTAQQAWREESERHGGKHFVPPLSDVKEPASITKYVDSRAELYGVFSECREMLEQNQNVQIAVVVPRLEHCLAKAQRAARQVFYPATDLDKLQTNHGCYEFSLGMALSQYPLIASAINTLSALTRSLNYQQACSLLDNPWSKLGTGVANKQLLTQLRKVASSTFTLTYLHERLKSLDQQADAVGALDSLKSAQSALPEKQSPGQWVETFDNVLDQIGWCRAAELDAAEFQQKEAWDKALRGCASLSGITAKVSLSEAVQMLRDSCAAPFQVQSMGAPLQIMGALEIAGQSYDQVWVTGLNDQDWPGSMRPHPFVPISLQREAGVPEADAEIFYQRMTNRTRRLMGSAPDLHLSFSSGVEELEPSRLIAGAEVCSAESPAFIEQAVPRTVEDNSGSAEEGPLARGGTSIFKNQSQCPFRAYAIHRLGAVRESEQELGLDASERGTLVHRALEDFWNTGETQTLLFDESARAEKLERALDVALAEQNYAIEGLRTAQRDIERERLRGVLGRWLKTEEIRTEPFSVEETELKWDGDIAGIEISFKLDRLDRLDDGRKVIIDYKTGKASVNDWFKDRPDEPQLPLYYLALNQQVLTAPSTGLAFGVINSKESKLDGVIEHEGKVVRIEPTKGARKIDFSSWSELQNRWQSVVDQLAKEFKSGHAKVSPSSDSACKYCELGEVCRIRQIPLPEQSNG